MSSAKARDISKGPVKAPGGNTNKSGNRNTSKGDIKSDKGDLNLKIQATPEQIQIARIIESHRSEDPDLQKKIKQIIEITGSTIDEASMALHSRDNNVEEAVNLLMEGGTESLEREWEQAGKKKKVKTAAQKAEAVKEQQQTGQRKDNSSSNRVRPDKRNEGDRGAGDRNASTFEQQSPEGGPAGLVEPRRGGGGRGRGRGEGRGRGGGFGRGGIRVENKENDESSDRDRGSFVPKYNMGAFRGRGRGGRGGFRGGDRDSSRTFASRTRGPRESDFVHNTIDVWENSQAEAKTEPKPPMKVGQWNGFPQTEDWDNEEYTGSLSESKVFVASAQSQNVPETLTSSSEASPPSNGDLGPDPTNSNGMISSTNNVGSGGNVVAGQSIDLNILLSKSSNGASGTSSATNPGANLLASIQSTYSSAAAQQVVQGQPVGNNNQTLSQRVKVLPSTQPPTVRPTQRNPISTKMPSSGVEMPDDSIAQLDVQFGGLDFGTSGSGFSSVVQHSQSKVGPSDMMFVGGSQSSNLVDSYVAAGEKEMVQNKSVPPVQESASPFQSQRNSTQAHQATAGSLISDSLAKSVPLTPPNLENAQLVNLSSVQSQNQSQQSQQKPPVSMSPQSQQQSFSNSTPGGNYGSAFVTYNAKPAPGFSAPGFPPVVSQTQQGGLGAYNAIPTGQVFGSQPSMIMTQPQQTSYGMGMSSYGTLPIPSASVQPSQTIPNQNMAQLSNSYGIAGSLYQTASTMSSSIAYAGGSTYQNAYQKLNHLGASGQIQGTKEISTDVSNTSATVPTTSSQLGPSNLQGNSTTSTVSGSKLSSNVTGSTTATSTSKLQNTAGGPGATAGTMPPGMMITSAPYILNQGGMPLYGFQGPMYSYDENQVQFMPRIPPHLATGYYDATSSFNPNGAGRTDGSSMQSYSATDARFTRSDSSAASPVPSNIAGQTTQPMYNLPQGPAGYYYLSNNPLMHGHFPQYPPPPQMYPTMVTPNNPSSGAPHSVSNHQYQSKAIFGNSYVNPYDTSAQAGLSSVNDYVNKNNYTTGSGVGGPSNSAGGGKGSASTTGSSQQSTDMSSSIYGNKGHVKMNPYEKQQYGVSTTSPYNTMGQQTNALGGAGMGTPYNVYMPPPVLPTIMFQDGGSGQRQGQPKGGKQQYGQQQYWSGN